MKKTGLPASSPSLQAYITVKNEVVGALSTNIILS